jgi:hypothetical protein
MTTIERFVLNLSAAFSKRMTTETTQFYIEKLEKYQSRANLSDSQWASAMSRLVAETEKFPALNQIYAFLHSERQKTGSLIPVWDMSSDNQVRRYAKRTGLFQSEVPDPQTIELWKQEAVYGPVARACFIEGYMNRPGATMDRCDEFLGMITKRTKPVPTPSRKDLAAGEQPELEEDDFPF